MKNTKLSIGKLVKAFSLTQMLVVIAVIGVIAAIAISGMDNIDQNAREATARQNARAITAMYNAALSAGHEPPAGLTEVAAYNAVMNGIVIKSGSFSGKVFRMFGLPQGGEDQNAIIRHLGIRGDKLLEYKGEP